jgi:hypothetical protein
MLNFYVNFISIKKQNTGLSQFSYIYIYRERERWREREGGRQREGEREREGTL